MKGKETKLILVRHGQSLGNAEQFMQGQMDTPLTELGRAQARALAKRLKTYDITAIYTSDLSRAHETARIVGAELGIEPIPDPRLREIDLGGWSGLTRDEVIARYPEEWNRWKEGKDIDHAGGESFSQFWLRIREALNEIVEKHRGETVLVVAHGGVTRMVASKVLGLGFREMFTDLPPMINTGITEILVKGDSIELLSLSDTAHLEEEKIVGRTTSWWIGKKRKTE